MGRAGEGTKNSFMALYLSEGHVVFALGADRKRLRLRSKERYHDGKWHTVRAGLCENGLSVLK
ncbi:hypothetical protein A6R68_23281 [Neotoma lepida]|uniref:Laminin G domain-containing protein n=1 Tax=Neotoma lepida TaxID=56216 RepID=A0A1A6HWV1_NEOLE|nr:hypothetical protein A6R68_23281 [Neotoma lepida]